MRYLWSNSKFGFSLQIFYFSGQRTSSGWNQTEIVQGYAKWPSASSEGVWRMGAGMPISWWKELLLGQFPVCLNIEPAEVGYVLILLHKSVVFNDIFSVHLLKMSHESLTACTWSRSIVTSINSWVIVKNIVMTMKMVNIWNTTMDHPSTTGNNWFLSLWRWFFYFTLFYYY